MKVIFTIIRPSKRSDMVHLKKFILEVKTALAKLVLLVIKMTKSKKSKYNLLIFMF